MTKSDLQREVLRLPVEEQLELAEAIWDRVEHAAPQPSLPDWQRDLLDERIAADDAEPEAGSPWGEVQQRILSKL
ncbi:MAG TPA: addiction module protein [Thermoanaerobaculia bacterium]|nr:addiction module protein [Thermoanaerobaculia bacterium]